MPKKLLILICVYYNDSHLLMNYKLDNSIFWENMDVCFTIVIMVSLLSVVEKVHAWISDNTNENKCLDKW